MKVKSRLKAIAASILLSAGLCPAGAAEPLFWERVPNHPAPAQFDTFHGETLDFRCTFTGFGALPAADLRLYYQTNGMGAAWWSLPADLTILPPPTNCHLSSVNCQPSTTNYQLTATFPPSADPGADRLTVFFGAPSNSYAAAQVRFRNSPGVAPNDLAPPSVLDWQSELASATNAVLQSALRADITTNDVIALIGSHAPTGLTTNDVRGIVTAESDAYSPWEFIGDDLITGGGYDTAGFSLTWNDSGGYWEASPGVVGFAEGSAIDDSAALHFDLYVYEDDQEIAYISANRYITGTRNALGLARLSDLPTDNAQLANGRGFVTATTDTFTVGHRAPNSAAPYGTLSVGTNNAATLIGSAAIGQDVVVRSSRSLGVGRNLRVTNATSVVWNSDVPASQYGSHGIGTFNINPNGGMFGVYIGDRNLYEIISDAIGQASAHSVDMALDEEGDDTETRVYQPIAVAREADLSPIRNNINSLWTYVYGNSVWIAVTNYMRTIEGVVPSFQLWEVRGGVTNCVYSSAEEIENTVTQKVNAAEARLRAAIPSPAWSGYQSATGAPNPQPGEITIVSTPAIQMTGGGEWFNYVTTGGRSIWVLQSNGLTTFGGGTNGFFRVRDDEGNTQMEVINTQDRWIDAIPSATGWDDGDFVVTYNWTASSHPTLYAAGDLSDAGVGEENGEINSLGISVSWAQVSGGYWAATLHQDTPASRLFVYAKIKQPGVKAVVNRSPTMMEGGIMYNGTQYRLGTATIDGKTVLTLETW